jgi:hypothetical protein
VGNAAEISRRMTRERGPAGGLSRVGPMAEHEAAAISARRKSVLAAGKARGVGRIDQIATWS